MVVATILVIASQALATREEWSGCTASRHAVSMSVSPSWCAVRAT
jgi:hypothetical protein